LRRSLPDAAGKDLAKFEAPLPDRLVADADLTSRQHFLDHAQA